MTAPRLLWDLGTAYDLFISLYVLHQPADFGVRGVWAAGMRSRLPAADREFLEEAAGVMQWGLPLGWSYELPPPKDAATALRELDRIAPRDRLPALMLPRHQRYGSDEVLQAVMRRGAFDDSDVDTLYTVVRDVRAATFAPTRKQVAAMLEWWVRPAEFGERYAHALHTYYEVFFAEEERRIYPALQSAYRAAHALAEQLPVLPLLEELSQGVALERAARADELILAPSYWSTPLVFIQELAGERMVILYGARPPEASLVPGEVVPDTLLRALKALSDPTRLKILHDLASESLTPTQLAQRLRLRPPTVVHHLKTLRVAGLVHVNVTEGKERSYAIRADSVEAALASLRSFLGAELPVSEAEPIEETG